MRHAILSKSGYNNRDQQQITAAELQRFHTYYETGDLS